jgi:hypothetical protein
MYDRYINKCLGQNINVPRPAAAAAAAAAGVAAAGVAAGVF